MDEILILNKFPIVLTKSRDWAESLKHPIKDGMIIVLPEDAILVSLPEIINVNR